MKKEWLILSEGYHGHSEMFQCLTPPHWGVPKDANTETLFPGLSDDQIKRACAVIIEPVIVDYSKDRLDWLKRLREKCTKFDTLLIFDEVITGLRFPRWCVSREMSVTPDILITGKAMAGGLPLAAVGGKKEVMDSDYFVSSTYAGETLSLRSFIKTVELLKEDPDYKIDDLWLRGQEFIDQFNSIWPEGLKIKGYPTRGVFDARDQETYALFIQEMAKARILFTSTWFFNYPLVDETENTLDIAKFVLSRIKRGEIKLEGHMPTTAFSQKSRRPS